MTVPSVPEPISAALHSGSCILLVLSQPQANEDSGCRKVTLRPVLVRGCPQFQATYQYADSVRHENLDAPAVLDLVGRMLPARFGQARLFTADADYTFHALTSGKLRTRRGPPTKRAVPVSHNREKGYLIPQGTPCPFLVETGVMTPDGQVRAAMYHKFRQVNRFLELVQDVVPALPRDRELRVIDFGCGKSYLTFALHHLLTALHGLRVRIVGLDRKADVVRTCTDLANRLRCEGLSFQVGDIAAHAEDQPVDLAVSLHACDTATDVALAKAVGWGCTVILAVPCCQHELAPQLHGETLGTLLEHGILRERFAALATDALRAEALELCGYSTQVVEFIDLEHTAKNLLLRAIRRNSSVPTLETRRQRYQDLKALLGVRTFSLEEALRREGLPALE